jgi:hypothetical protein
MMLTGATTVGVHARNLPIAVRPMTDRGHVAVVDEISHAAKTLQNVASTNLGSADREAGCVRGGCNAKLSEVLVTATMNGPGASTRAVSSGNVGPNIAVPVASVARVAGSVCDAATDTNGPVTGRDINFAGVTSAAAIISKNASLGLGLTDAAGGIIADTVVGRDLATLDVAVMVGPTIGDLS